MVKNHFNKIKKLGQPGRFFFFKGIFRLPLGQAIPDSKSADYYLLILQESRREFCDFSLVLKESSFRKNPLRWIYLTCQHFIRYQHIKAANQIALSYAIERKLLDADYGTGKSRGS